MVISRLPEPEDGSKPKTSSAVALLLVLAVVLGVWLINGRDPGTGTGLTGDATPIGDPTSYVDTGPPTTDPTADPTPDPTTEPAGEDPGNGLPTVALADLPPQASETVALIDRGPPYPYDQDGSTFGNYEGVLPSRERGYYEEFTVETPGSGDRGARRIVAGDAGELYWTEDHYRTFERIRR